MRKSVWVPVVILILCFGCKNSKKKSGAVEAQGSMESELPKTYAEISIAEGGEWNGKVYENGSSFKNVEELWVPDSHTDHSWYIRYEGPGWESNKVGYRLYLDWRNAIDIFGKTTDRLILDQVGQDGFDSYHERQAWGMDVLKVGKALGLGSYGRMIADSVHKFQKVDSTFVQILDTPKSSGANINYHGWQTGDTKINLATSFSIEPDSRITKAVLNTSNAIEGLVTGVVKVEGVDLIQSNNEDGIWAYVATYGEQTLVPDNLGMAIFYQKSQITALIDGKYDHLIHFKPSVEPITYQFAAAWEQEPNGINNERAFLSYLNEELNRLNQ